MKLVITQKLYPSQFNYLLEVFELLVSGETLFLGHAAVDGDGGEVLLRQQLGQGDAPLHRLDEDDDLKKKVRLGCKISFGENWLHRLKKCFRQLLKYVLA